MRRPLAGFQWDRGNREKCQQHGVSILAIESAFESPIAVFPDPRHSSTEERFKALGMTTDGRHILIVFTLRLTDGKTFVRPISARYMPRREIDHYEKAVADLAQR